MLPPHPPLTGLPLRQTRGIGLGYGTGAAGPQEEVSYWVMGRRETPPVWMETLMSWRDALRDGMQTGDVIGRLEIWWVGDGGDGV